MVSNISFVSNVNVIKKPFDSFEGDKFFLRKVAGYRALSKLRRKMGGTTNSYYYVFTADQIHQVMDHIEAGVAVNYKKDPAIEAQNKEYDKKYGYDYYDHSRFYPIKGEEVRPDYSHINNKYDSHQKTVGRWENISEQRSTTDAGGDGKNPTTYYFKKIEKDISKAGQFVNPNVVFSGEFQDDDPYYYIYRTTATSEKKPVDIDPAEAYLQVYDIQNAFSVMSQDKVIEADPNENIFVDAGPGTGKTYTLIQRINYLVQNKDVDPESIVVLCFTNAAVNEIKERFQKFISDGGTRGLINVDIRTFHSFAWWLIGQANSEFVGQKGYKSINLHDLTYDSSLVRAKYIIDNFGEEVFGGWSHFIVDEIQDLTDVRARFVLSIVRQCLQNGVGITAFGDSCQAIYDYNQGEVTYPMSSDNFYQRLFKLFFNHGKYGRFTLNHRQSDQLINLTQNMRTAILSGKNVKMQVEASRLKSPDSGIKQIEGKNISLNLENKQLDILRDGGKLCLLCRNNAQVLRLSSNLRRRGISHVINVYEDTRLFAGWIGAVFYGYQKAKITYEEFSELCKNHNVNKPEIELWHKIQDSIGTDNDTLIVDDILKCIVLSKVDDPVFRNIPSGNIIVSNIHRAKGREYQTVILQKSFLVNLAKEARDISEYKTLYVAITRPKQHLYCANLVTTKSKLWTIFKTGRKRWINRDEGGTLRFMEIRGNTDIDVASFIRQNPDAIQKYICRNVNSGDEMKLVRSSDKNTFHYDIVHINGDDEYKLGETTQDFIEDLKELVNPYTFFEWPAEIDELYVTGVFTEFSDKGNQHVWCWPNFCGMGHVMYDVY